MRLEKVNLSQLKKYENNSKLHPDWHIEQIKNSISQFGYNDPIAIDENNVIIEGHGRYEALKQLNFKEIEIIRLVGLTEEQKSAYIIAHNKITMNTDFDLEKLKIELDKIENSGLDLNLTGFKMEELNNLLLDLPSNLEDMSIPEEEIEEFPEDYIPFTQEGDLWIIGNHRLLCGDSTKKEDVLKLMNGKLADLVITDPPYNVNYEGATKDKLTIKNDNMDNESFYKFLFEVYSRLFENSKDGAGIYVFHADGEGLNFRKAMIETGWKNSQCCIWVKNSIVMGRQDYHSQHEPILVGWKPTGSHKWYADRKQSTIWNFNKPQRNDIHPTMKPIELIAYPVQNSSKIGDLVLDLFGGSGSTLIAAETLKRIAYLMEIDPKYCDASIKRFFNFNQNAKIKLIRNNKELQWEEFKNKLG